jgi:hypothetical protein
MTEGIGKPLEIYARGSPLTQKRDNLFAIPLKNLKVKLKMHGATDGFKNYQFIFHIDFIHLYRF